MLHPPCAALAAHPEVGPQRRAERGAGVTGGGLHPHVVERAAIADLRVHHAVQRDAARHRELPLAGAGGQPVDRLQRRFFQHALQRMRDVAVMRLDRAAAFARRAEHRNEIAVEDRVASVAVVAHQLAHRVGEHRLAVRRERHHLVLVGRVQEAEVARHAFVQQPERMRQVDLSRAAGTTGRRTRRSSSSHARRARPSSSPRSARKAPRNALASCARWCSTKCQRNGPSCVTPRKRRCRWCGAPPASWRGAFTIDDRNSGCHGDAPPLRGAWADGESGKVSDGSAVSRSARTTGRTNTRRGRRPRARCRPPRDSSRSHGRAAPRSRTVPGASHASRA